MSSRSLARSFVTQSTYDDARVDVIAVAVVGQLHTDVIIFSNRTNASRRLLFFFFSFFCYCADEKG